MIAGLRWVPDGCQHVRGSACEELAEHSEGRRFWGFEPAPWRKWDWILIWRSGQWLYLGTGHHLEEVMWAAYGGRGEGDSVTCLRERDVVVPVLGVLGKGWGLLSWEMRVVRLQYRREFEFGVIAVGQ